VVNSAALAGRLLRSRLIAASTSWTSSKGASGHNDPSGRGVSIMTAASTSTALLPSKGGRPASDW
jgi:hypothetical protein